MTNGRAGLFYAAAFIAIAVFLGALSLSTSDALERDKARCVADGGVPYVASRSYDVLCVDPKAIIQQRRK